MPNAPEPPVIVHAIGGRADAVRLAPVIGALERQDVFRQVVVHTGSAQDRGLVGELADELGLPAADHVLDVGAGSDAGLTAQTLTAFDALLRELPPELVMLSGDTNATLSCALAAAKRQVAVAHVGSGLRSWDWTTPEEINRVVIDRLSDTLFTHSHEAVDNLLAEGVSDGRVHPVGSTVVDALRRVEPAIRSREAWTALDLPPGDYVLVMLHHRDAIADGARRDALVAGLATLAGEAPVAFALHPAAAPTLNAAGAIARLQAAGVRTVPPMGHVDFLSLELGAGAIVTDSGTVQEEATVLGVPCYTPGSLSEGRITLTHGTNVLLGEDAGAVATVRPSRTDHAPCVVPLWDGRAGERIAAAILANYAVRADQSSTSLR
ncbi:UDP-N-acetyl glucosamine 2-epimerase [Baekduia soli]|uniref:UDP-N-acetyl glucosamine 2-epimerase n=1 Tax=Baekduia soli TaxID=496014 RepID=UPI0016521988|nr:UDP-N-acetyl glucosamine 2-epimerase [Baekduia soli]